MASFAAQLQSAQAASRAAFSVEAANRQLIENLFDSYAAGMISTRQMRFRLEAVVRSAYRASGELGRDLARRLSEIPGWSPENATQSTPYLDSLQSDVRRTFSEYRQLMERKTLSPEARMKARRRAIMRAQHSAGVATTRGYTDALIAAYRELEEKGLRVEKIWVANFVNNEPCPRCVYLHGQRVGIGVPFRDQDEAGIYRDLQGPPRHPRCKCHLVPLVIGLENAEEDIDVDAPAQSERDSMTADEIRNMATPVYHSVLRALGLIARS